MGYIFVPESIHGSNFNESDIDSESCHIVWNNL